MRVSARKGAVAGVIGLALVLTACGGDDDGGDEASGEGATGGAVSVRGCNPQNPLVPGNTQETCGGDVLDQLFSKLVRYDPETAEPLNEIAASIESDDNITWTITLNEGWTFHNGDPITAQSFVDAWNYTAYAPNAYLNSYFFEPIQGYADLQPAEPPADDAPVTPDMVAAEEMSGLEVIDDTSFTVTLTEPMSSFPIRLGYTAFSPLPTQFFDDPAAFGEAPIGTGPFEFVSWEPNVEIKLQAYDDYQGEAKPKIDEATFKIYEDDNAAYADLQADNLDIVPQLPTAALAGETYKSDLGERFIERETGVFQSFTFAPETVSPELANPQLRQAISMAVDRQSIIDTIFEGQREPATGWVAPVVDGFEPGACGEYCEFNPERANELLAEAGGFTGSLTLAYNGDADHQPWVDATCNSIKNTLGIECTGVPEVDFATFRTKITNREMPGMFRTGWQMDYPASENFLTPIYATGASSNDGDYSNPEFDAKLDEAAQAEGDEANALYNEAEAMLADDMPAVPLWYGKTIAGYSTKVENVKITPFQTVDLTSVTVAG
jgi:oligopeptide transport system substrate-binding protein